MKVQTKESTLYRFLLICCASLVLVIALPSFIGRVTASTISAEPAFQPSAPFYATFYYPWYQSPASDGRWGGWEGHENHPPATWFSHYLPDIETTQFDPAQELYSSRDPAVLYWQLRKMAEARIEVAISSWWGAGGQTDQAFAFMLGDVMQRPDNPYPNLRWALYYEAESTGDPTPQAIANDLNYIATHYADESAYLQIDGKPVIFVYADNTDDAALTQRWHEANQLAGRPFYVVLKVFANYRNVTPQPDSWHQYAPAVRASDQSPYSFGVSPGFWLDTANTAPKLPRNPAEFRAAVEAMVASNATWKLITTWNEWGEGTAVEPGDPVVFNPATGREEYDASGAPFQNGYISVLAELLPPLENGTGEGGAPPPTPLPGGTLPPPAFSFAAGGDHGGNDRTTATLGRLGKSGVDFYLALGDMSYSDITPESAWCAYVKNQVGPAFPFEVLAGNHEDQAGENGFIDEFAQCLPDRLGVQGIYAHRYFFDYPGNAPLARFILIDPALDRTGTRVEFCKKGEVENCDWLKARIDEAHAQGLWVIVGMHKNCITMGEKSCEIGQELLDVLVSKKVDLILQGHEHLYERSRQLALNANCPTIAVNAYDADCVVAAGAGNRFPRGAGSLIVVAGTMGAKLRDVALNDPEQPYFAAWMGANEQPSYGFVRYTVSACAIYAETEAAIGDYRDEFVIVTAAETNPACTGVSAPPPAQGNLISTMAQLTPSIPTTLTATASMGSVSSVTIALLFPSGAVTESTTVTLTVTAPAATMATSAGQEAPTLQESGLTNLQFTVDAITAGGVTQTQFMLPYTITVHYTDANVSDIDEQKLALRIYHPTVQVWAAIETQPDPVNNCLSAAVDRPGAFGITVVAGASQPFVTHPPPCSGRGMQLFLPSIYSLHAFQKYQRIGSEW
ncbi:MAG: metallophosphoesterase [Caldilineaceae bacterium]|nr:metallophosphoesterase [Caldilineaceae bacterium]